MVARVPGQPAARRSARRLIPRSIARPRRSVWAGDTPAPYDFTWAFVLRETTAGTTRLLVRERYRYARWWTPLLVEPVVAISFVMSRKMLRGIRDRAERTAAPVPPDAGPVVGDPC